MAHLKKVSSKIIKDYNTEDERKQEIIALKSIYQNDFEEAAEYAYYLPYKFNIKLTEEDVKGQTRSVKMNFYLGVNYPNKEPRLNILDHFNLTRPQRSSLMSHLSLFAKHNKGEAMVHDIILEAKEIMRNLEAHTKKDNKIEESSLEQKLMEENEKLKKDREMLMSNIEAELERKRQKLKMEQKNLMEDIFVSCSVAETDLEEESSDLSLENLSLDDENDPRIDFTSKKIKSRYQRDFEELEKLGKGAFGVVYKVRNRLDRLCYAVKRLKVRRKDKQSLENLLSEVKAVSRLTHSNVVRYYQAWVEEAEENDFTETEDEKSDLFEDESGSYYDESFVQESGREEKNSINFLFIQMEYCKGKTLKELMDNPDMITKETIWKFFVQIMDVLNFIHSKDIIHRDIKPKNIFLDGHNNIKIGDFGLAVAKRSTKTEQTSQVGTPFYSAPEQRQKGGISSFRTDMYPVGIILLEMCAEFQTLMERLKEVNELRKTASLTDNLRSKVDKKCSFVSKDKVYLISDIIESLMDPDQNKRPESLEDLVARELIPLGMVDSSFNTALSELGKRESTFRTKALKKIFSTKNPPHIAFTYDSETSQSVPDEFLDVLCEKRNNIIKEMRKVFDKHGLIEVDTPLLEPSTKEVKNSVNLLDSEGNILLLPHCLFVSIARYVALLGIKALDRYTISPLFEESMTGSQPKAKTEGHFNFIFQKPTSKNERVESFTIAESLFIVYEILEGLSTDLGRNCEVLFSHSEIVSELIKEFEKRFDIFRNKDILKKICSFLGDSKMASKHQIINFLRKDIGIDLKSVEFLMKFLCGKGSVEELQKLFVGEFGVKFNSYFDEILEVIDNLKIFTVDFEIKCQIDLLKVLSICNPLKFNGIVFCVQTQKTEIFSRGGRFDALINKFCHPGREQCQTFAFGVSISIGKLEKILYEMNRDEIYGNSSSAKVLLYSQGNQFLEERVKFASVLWRAGVRVKVEYRKPGSYPDLSTVVRNCRLTKTPWLILFRNSDLKNKTLRVYRVGKKIESNCISTEAATRFLLKIGSQNTLAGENAPFQSLNHTSAADIKLKFDPKNWRSAKRVCEENFKVVGQGSLKAHAKLKLIYKAYDNLSAIVDNLEDGSYYIIISDLPLVELRSVGNGILRDVISKKNVPLRKLLKISRDVLQSRKPKYLFLFSSKDGGFDLVLNQNQKNKC